MPLYPIPALRDNYIWLLQGPHDRALIVDPGESEPVLQVLEEHKLDLVSILLTHHHPDHIGGSQTLAERTEAHVVAPHDERIAHADQRVADGDTVHVPDIDWRFTALSVPGHTRSHVAYFGEGILFAGDTLFSLGCGRLFEGTPEQMLASLDRLAELPDDTLLCCGHEYTLANAAFAQTIEPDNAELEDRRRHAAQLRDNDRATVPVALADERKTNPFLRVDSPAVRAWAQTQGAADNRIQRFAALRAAKDQFNA